MYEFIPSRHYREFAEKNKIAFSDRERAAMLRKNTQLPLIRQIAALEKLSSETNDADLKNEIDAWIEYKNELLERMRDHSRGKDFFSVSCCYGDSTGVLFDSLESALKWLENNPDKFGEHFIAKRGYFGENTSELGYECAVEINRSGEIVSVYEPGDIKPRVVARSEFIPFANPFERGNIVRDCRDGKIGVVETDRSDWIEFLNDCESAKIPYNGNLGDMLNNESIKIRSTIFPRRKCRRFNFDLAGLDIVFPQKFLAQNGKLEKKIIQPIYLEKLTADELKALLIFDPNIVSDNEMICRISDLFCHRIGLDSFSTVLVQWTVQKRYAKYGGVYL